MLFNNVFLRTRLAPSLNKSLAIHTALLVFDGTLLNSINTPLVLGSQSVNGILSKIVSKLVQ